MKILKEAMCQWCGKKFMYESHKYNIRKYCTRECFYSYLKDLHTNNQNTSYEANISQPALVIGALVLLMIAVMVVIAAAK